jgi:hypothetical protein
MLGLGIDLGMRTGRQSWPAGALYAADFIENRYMRDGAPVVAAAAFAFTRASGKRAADRNGIWQAFAADVPARTDRGVLIEPAASNGLPNTALAGAVPGTTDLLDGLPANWTRSKIDGTNIKGRLLALATWRGLPAMTLRLWGSSTVDDAQVLFAATTDMALAKNDTAIASLFTQLLAGSTANVSTRLRLTEQDAAGTYVGKQLSLFTPTADGTRAFERFTIAGAATARATTTLEFALSGAFDLTLRIAAPQMEKSAATQPSSPIITGMVPAPRAADALTLKLPDAPCDVTLNLDGGSSLMLTGVSGDVTLDPAQFGGTPLRSAIAVPAA